MREDNNRRWLLNPFIIRQHQKYLHHGDGRSVHKELPHRAANTTVRWFQLQELWLIFSFFFFFFFTDCCPFFSLFGYFLVSERSSNGERSKWFVSAVRLWHHLRRARTFFVVKRNNFFPRVSRKTSQKGKNFQVGARFLNIFFVFVCLFVCLFVYLYVTWIFISFYFFLCVCFWRRDWKDARRRIDGSFDGARCIGRGRWFLMRSLAVLFFLSARRARLFHSRGGSPFHLLWLLFLLLCSLCMLFQVVDIDKRREKEGGKKEEKETSVDWPPSIHPSIHLVIESVRLGYRQYINVHPSDRRSVQLIDMIWYDDTIC